MSHFFLHSQAGHALLFSYVLGIIMALYLTADIYSGFMYLREPGSRIGFKTKAALFGLCLLSLGRVVFMGYRLSRQAQRPELVLIPIRKD